MRSSAPLSCQVLLQTTSCMQMETSFGERRVHLTPLGRIHALQVCLYSHVWKDLPPSASSPSTVRCGWSRACFLFTSGPQTLAALSPLIARRLADIQGKAFMFLCCPASLGASLLTVMWYFCSALLRHEGCHCGGGGLVSVGALFLWTVEAFQFVLACDPAPFL